MPPFSFNRFFIIDRTDFFHLFFPSENAQKRLPFRQVCVFAAQTVGTRVSVRLISAGYFVLRSGSCTRWASSRLNHGTFC